VRGLLVGRFQPFHRGHVAVVRHLTHERPNEPLILGIGSAAESYTPDNPFTAAERFQMISLALGEENLANWIAVPIPDIHRHALWVAHVKELVPPFDRVYTNNPLTRTLFEAGGYAVEATPMFERKKFEGTAIREMIRDGTIGWQDRVSPTVANYLEGLHATDRLSSFGPTRTG
jgi:nicotinamide-nucleotide adenylyltransferase